MNHRYTRVSTEEFWYLMCRAGFVRTGYYAGMSRGQRYWCDYPPETAPGFMGRVIYGISTHLGIRVSLWERLLKWTLSLQRL